MAEDGLARSAEDAGEGGVDIGQRVSGGRCGSDEYTIDARFDGPVAQRDGPLVGMDVGVEGQAEVEHDDLEQRIESRAEGVEIALRRGPGCLQHVGKVLAEGTDIPFRRQPDAGMRHTDAQPAGDIGGAVIAGGQAVEIAAVRLLQPADGCLVGQQRGQFRQPAQVLVETVGKTVLGGGQLAADGPQLLGIGFAEFEESLAGFDLVRIDAHFGGDAIDLARSGRPVGCAAHRPPRSVPAVRMRSMPAITVRLASSIRVRASRAPVKSLLR